MDQQPKKEVGVKQKGEAKTARIPIKIIPVAKEEALKKPKWLKAQFPGGEEVDSLKKILRDNNLHTVCEEATCPNLGECFRKGTATFMILGDICTRRCPFCDVAHGKPNPPDVNEPENLGKTIAQMKLKYVVITSVDRDDLRDGGAKHFVDCIVSARKYSPSLQIETLVPDFRGRLEIALEILGESLPNVLNHNLETVPRLYKQARPGADYQNSLTLLKEFKKLYPNVSTKSGIMVGLGETDDEILEVMQDLRNHDVNMLTLGQYLQPSSHHLPVLRYLEPDQFKFFEEKGYEMGFTHVASSPLVRSSYHADQQAHNAGAV